MILKRIGQWLTNFDSNEAEIRPAIKTDVESVDWHYNSDVLVVGFGGAGASAALEARENGADVSILERYDGGGATNISGGIYYAGGGTNIQQQAQVEDDADNMFNYLKHEVKDSVGEETLREFCQQSPANFEWLQGHGLEFHASLCPFKTSYPSDRYYLYYSGNESFAPYNEDATPAPRGHRSYGKGISGAAFFAPLRSACEEAQINIKTQTYVQGLITDQQNRVLGVTATEIPANSFAAKLHKWLYLLTIYLRYASMYVPMIRGTLHRCMRGLEKRYGRSVNHRAHQGVILSTGGFYFNHSMVTQNAPQHSKGLPLGTVGDDGSGIQLGQTVAGKTSLMEKISAWRFINPPETFTRGVLVGNRGARICNEMLYGAQIGERMNTEHEGVAHVIIDQSLWNQTWRMIKSDRATWFQALLAIIYLFAERKKAKSIVALAVKLGIEPAVLQKTIDEYNALADTKQADPMGKPSDFINKIETGPFYALNCSFDAYLVGCPSISVGGLLVDEKTGQVNNDSGDIIEGLYAAGRTAVGICSRSYVSGLSIADCVYAGRRAGKHAASQDKSA